MSDLIIFASATVVLVAAVGFAFIAVNRHLAQRRQERLTRHLSWNGGHRTPRVAAARRG